MLNPIDNTSSLLSTSLSKSFSDVTPSLDTFATAAPPALAVAGGAVQPEAYLGPRVSDICQLRERCADLELVIQEQLGQSQQQANTVKRLQAQIVLLEERLRLTSDCTDKLQAENEQLRSSNQQLQQQALLLQQQLTSAALSTLQLGNSGSAVDELEGETNLPSVRSLEQACHSIDSNAVCVPLNTRSSNQIGYSEHGVKGESIGLETDATTASCPAADLLGSYKEAAAQLNSFSSVYRTLSSSFHHELPCTQRMPEVCFGHQPTVGLSAAGTIPARSSFQQFTHDAEVSSAAFRPHRSQSLLSARELGAISDAWVAADKSSMPCSSSGVASSNTRLKATSSCSARMPAGPTAPQPILAQPRCRRHPDSRQPVAASGGLGDNSWHSQGAMCLSVSTGAPGSITSACDMSQASWEHPLLLAGRQGSLLDALPHAASRSSHGDLLSSVTTAADYLSLPGANAAALAAAVSGLTSSSMDDQHSLQSATVVPTERVVADPCLGMMAAIDTILSPASMINCGRLGNLGQTAAAAAQLHQQLHVQQVAAAAATAAAAAASAATAVAMSGTLDPVGGTVRGGKPIPAAYPSSVNRGHTDVNQHHSNAGRLVTSRVQAAPAVSNAEAYGQHAGCSTVQSAVSSQTASFQRCADDAISKQASSIEHKWQDTWSPQQDASSVHYLHTADTKDDNDQGYSSNLNAPVTEQQQDRQQEPEQQQHDHLGSHRSAGGTSSSYDTPLCLSASISSPNVASMTSCIPPVVAVTITDAEIDGVPGQEMDAGAQNARLRSKADAWPNTCVYVGFLGWWVTESDLVEYFSPYGDLASVRLLISKKSRRSREQAFVEYGTVEQAQRAITWLDAIDHPALVKQLGCGGLVVRFADRKKTALET